MRHRGLSRRLCRPRRCVLLLRRPRSPRRRRPPRASHAAAAAPAAAIAAAIAASAAATASADADADVGHVADAPFAPRRRRRYAGRRGARRRGARGRRGERLLWVGVGVGLGV